MVVSHPAMEAPSCRKFNDSVHGMAEQEEPTPS
jgi:hypothetical protein